MSFVISTILKLSQSHFQSKTKTNRGKMQAVNLIKWSNKHLNTSHIQWNTAWFKVKKKNISTAPRGELQCVCKHWLCVPYVLIKFDSLLTQMLQLLFTMVKRKCIWPSWPSLSILGYPSPNLNLSKHLSIYGERFNTYICWQRVCLQHHSFK